MNIIQILLIAGLVVFIIVRRFAGQPVASKSSILPVGITVWGLIQMRGSHLGAADMAFLAIEVLVAIGVGLARGATIQLYTRAGQLWQRYRWTTLVVWLAAIAVRIGLAIGGHLMGVHVVNQSLMFVLGLSFIAEGALVAWRAAQTGVPRAASRHRVTA
jgi:hypothetical protein